MTPSEMMRQIVRLRKQSDDLMKLFQRTFGAAETQDLQELTEEPDEVSSCHVASPPIPRREFFRSGDMLIRKERRRQMEELGYGSNHDDRHQGEELVHWAVHRLFTPVGSVEERIKYLVNAGALLAAEIDRLQRRFKG